MVVNKSFSKTLAICSIYLSVIFWYHHCWEYLIPVEILNCICNSFVIHVSKALKIYKCVILTSFFIIMCTSTKNIYIKLLLTAFRVVSANLIYTKLQFVIYFNICKTPVMPPKVTHMQAIYKDFWSSRNLKENSLLMLVKLYKCTTFSYSV